MGYADATILKECTRPDGRLRAEAMWELANEKGAVGKHHARNFAKALQSSHVPKDAAAVLARVARAMKASNRSSQEEDGTRDRKDLPATQYNII